MMNFLKKNNTPIIIVLGGALIVTLCIILYMLFNKSSTDGYSKPNTPPARAPAQGGAQRQAKDASAPAPKPQGGAPQGPKPTMVLFHMNGCGPCAQVKPIWESVKQHLMSNGQINMLEIESQNTQEIQRNKIAGFPTIKMFPQGYPAPPETGVEYNGPRTADGIMKFALTGQQ